MLDRLQLLEDRYEQLNELLSGPEVISDIDKLREYSKEQADLSEVVRKYRRYKNAAEEVADAKEMLQDDELDGETAEMAKSELAALSETTQSIEEQRRELRLRNCP